MTGEVAHVVKGQSEKRLEDMIYNKCTGDEQEADSLAMKWLSKHYQKDSLWDIIKSKGIYKGRRGACKQGT